MYYQVYGVLSLSGHNVLIGSAKSRKQAFKLVEGMNELIYPYFAITERRSKHNIILGALTGRTVERLATVDTLLIAPTAQNDFLTNPKTGRAFWEKLHGNKN